MNEPLDTAVRRHGATVLRVCRALLGPGPEADDAWSETFLAALRAWPDLPPSTNVEAWLVRVAQRKSIDLIRAAARHPAPTDELPEAAYGHDDSATERSRVWQRVAALPERQRLALAYHYLGGLRHTETADLIGGSPASVRRAAADGVKSLRQAYAADEPQNGERP